MHTWLEISRKNILHNLRQFRKIIGKEKLLMPVVKSNAYGHGIVDIAKLIDQSKLADKICVVNSQEALLLKKNGIQSPILILSYWNLYDIRKLVSSYTNNIEVVIYDFEQIKLLKSLNKKIKIHIKIDTGTSRLGFLTNDIIDIIKKINKYKNIEIIGIFTHYANSEEDNAFTRDQNKKLIFIKKQLENFGFNLKYHAACSAAVLSNKDNLFDGLRLGISLYGYWPSLYSRRLARKQYPWLKLKPALTWKTKIIQIKKIPANTFIGYGCSYLTKKKIKLAILPVGYYEGYDRGLSNCGEVFVNNKKCPIVGRVCMNLIMIDVSRIKQIKLNDKVELIGLNIKVEEMAQKLRTINYELMVRINPLLPRLYY